MIPDSLKTLSLVFIAALSSGCKQDSVDIDDNDINISIGVLIDRDENNNDVPGDTETNGVTVGVTAFAPVIEGSVNYSLIDSGNGLFVIDGGTGVVTVGDYSLLDAENNPEIVIQVLAINQYESISTESFTINVIPSLVTDPDEETGPVSLDPIMIIQASDDGYSWTAIDSDWENDNIDFNFIRLGGAGNVNREYVASFMFRGIMIPEGKVITSANIIFSPYVDQGDEGNLSLIISGIDPSSQDYFSIGNMGQDRVATSTNVNWNKSLTDLETPDLSVILQEIISDQDWTTNNAVGFLIKNNGVTQDGLRHNVAAFNESDNLNYPQLVIVYDNSSTGESDDTPAQLSLGLPSGTLLSGTLETDLSVTSNENAFCRYDNLAGTDFASMPNQLNSEDNRFHVDTLSNLSADSSYIFYVKCQDESGNVNSSDYIISFSIDAAQLDEDTDGVSDADDQCPGTPAGDAANINGCSPTQLDEDTDGVSDADDQCPGTPAGDAANINGCSPSQVEVSTPIITTILDQSIDKNSVFTLSPVLDNTSTAGSVHWTKAYGPDDVQIHPVTGAISWNISAAIPSESFHIGVKAANGNSFNIESFIVHVDIDKIVTIGAGETYETMADAFDSERLVGTTFVIRNGIYSGAENRIGRISNGDVQHPPEGNANQYTTVIAEDPGEVTLVDGAYIYINGIYGPVGYLAFKGIFVDGDVIGTNGYGDDICQVPEGCRPHHIKFIRNGVKADETTPFNAFRSSDILFENNYAFGGGRYKFASYQSSNIVWRRNVARRDRSTTHGEPKGTYSVYTTMEALVANNLAIDGDQDRFAVQGQRAGEFTCPTTSGDTRVIFTRNMQLNSEHMFGNADNQAGICDGQYTDMVSWDVRPLGAYVMTRAASLYNHVTFGNIKPKTSAPAFFNAWPSNYARGVTNSVLHDFDAANNEALFYGFHASDSITVIDRELERYGIDTVNLSEISDGVSACCTDVKDDTITDVNPLYSATNIQGGIRYLTRIENDSNLSGLALDGGDLGATVMTFMGKSGTFFGEEGYDVETNIPMWPFPFEDKIREMFADYSYTGPTYTGPSDSRVEGPTESVSGARGFAFTGESLSNYVWGYLGNTVPPFNVTATAASETSVLIQWNPHADNARNTITSFNVYDFSPSTGVLSAPRTVSESSFELLITGLSAGIEYHFVVTAIDSTMGESSYSYSVGVAP